MDINRSNRDVQSIALHAGPPRFGASESAPAMQAVDWSAWLRQVERKRRLISRLSPPRELVHREFSATFSAQLTIASFRLDGLDVAEDQVHEAVNAAPGRRPFRSRLSQRLRNHLAILCGIGRLLAAGRALKAGAVVRWYTSISCGLCNTSLDEATMNRLSTVAGRISSPRLRLQPAVQDVARLHAQLMADPLVPSFNGILARLLLCYHLGRCGLPPVLLDPGYDRLILADESRLLPRLMDLIEASYSLLLAE